MKKNIVFLSACLLLCSLCGCNFDTAVADQTSTVSVAASESSVTHETTKQTQIPSETTAAETTEEETETTHETDAETVKGEAPTEAAPSQTATSTAAAGTSASTTQSDPGDTTATRKRLLDQLRESIEGSVRKKDPAFFDNVVFIGDSVTMGLKNYTNAQRNKGNACLGSAQFLCCGSMGYTNTLGKVGSGSMHPTYKGSKVSVEDGISQCGAGKAFIMLGMNDFSAYGESTWKSSVTTLLDRIAAENPRVEIYLESVTPIVNGKEYGKFTNEHIRQFNAYLQSVCDDRGYTYVDIYSVLADESGYLKKSNCGDASAMGIHMSNEGSAAWVQYLQTTFCGTDS